MERSLKATPKKKRGRPATGSDARVTHRLPQPLVDQVQDWASANDISRSDAFRRLIELGLKAKGKMRNPPPQQWTEFEVRRLRVLAQRKVSADKIAKSLGRYVGSVKIKARELGLLLLRKGVRPSGKKPPQLLI